MVYKRWTNQFDNIANNEEIARQVSSALEKLLGDTGVVFDVDYHIKFATDGICTMQATLTLDTAVDNDK